MPKPSKRDQLAEATKELQWEVGYEAMSPRDVQARSRQARQPLLPLPV
jgi:TetR/AcrR family transcriptional repressor of nem operon